MPSLRLLRAFVAVAETGQLATAARRLNVTQPALSLQLKDLETRLGVTLIERKPGLRRTGADKTAQLTAAGAALLPRARNILTASTELEDTAAALVAPLAGRLRLGVIPTIAPYLLPRLLGPLARAYPAAALQVVEDKTDALVAALRDGSLDLALLALPLGHSDLTELPLFDDAFHLVAPVGHMLMAQKKLSPADLLGGPLLLLDDGQLSARPGAEFLPDTRCAPAGEWRACCQPGDAGRADHPWPRRHPVA